MTNIRNFCIIAHIDHGKSTLADRFLEITKTVEAREMREQYLDQMDLERERGITIKLQPVRMVYHPTQIKTDKKDKADNNGLLYEELTYKIRGVIFRVYNELGPGYKESIYQKALEEELSRARISFQKEYSVDIFYNSKKVGVYKPDFLIDDKVILEIKALPFIGKLEKKQTWHYLKGTNYKLALLVNFGSTKLQIDRIIYNIGYNPRENPFKSELVVLNLIDTPGHVDFSYEVSRSLAAVEGAILLVDATKGIQAQTLANLQHAQAQNLDIIPVVNKIDLANAQVEETVTELAKLLNISEDKILRVSAKTGQGVSAILNTVVECIKSPQGKSDMPLRALVFDSVYDSYRGVVAHVRVVDGSIKKGDKIRLMATNVEDEALEVGYFTPQMKESNELKTGEIGYVVTGLKDVSQCRVGDTITTQINADRKIHADQRGFNISDNQCFNRRESAIQPLAGYKEPQPMVYACVYTADGEVNKLREAIGKLKLNDAALQYQPENSTAFGFGFRCGFLGLLHMEIFKERLEREYGLELIITTPQVNYQHASASISNPLKSVLYEEPWADLQIVTPQQYIGKIMDYLNNVRGMYKSTEYLGDQVILKYQAPLASIVVNFYDKLKSISSGYASMSYEFIDYRAGDLVKLDIIVASEKIDVLSQIVHRSQMVAVAKNLVKKLKELIPRQMFQVSLQAAVGAKILAREDIPAMKKDVTGYLYGGDITRKKKLWAKQARGKKKMKKLGRVDIPTDVFINLLKQ